MPGYGLGYSSLLSRVPFVSGPTYGTLTTAWIAATGETDLTILGALNTLESDLATYGLTSKMKALYPFVGGTATKHKFNFMNAQDTDAAFRLVFNGGWTHSSTGVLPNGTNAYADTKLIPSTDFTKFDHHFSLYSRTNNKRDVFNGSRNSGSFQAEVMILRSTDAPNGVFYYWSYGWAASNISVNNTDSTGLFLVTNRTSTDREAYRNGSTIGTNTYNMTPYDAATNSMFLSSENLNGSANGYDNKEIAFASLGSGLTDTESANFYTAVQAFQTTLSRNV